MSRSLRPETSCDRPSSHLRNMDVNMAAELSPTNSSSSGELSVSPEPPRETQAFLGKVTVIDYFTFQHKHLKVTNIDDMTETLYVKLPENMTRCDHLPITCEYLLGRGSYGAVYAHADNATVKLYDSVTELYHELMVCDMIQIGKATAEDGQDKALVDYLSACTSCHALFMPQFRCSLQDYGHWHDGSIEPLVRGFQGLKDAVYFLNRHCGLFHSDISPSNILVDFTDTMWGMGRLVLTDYGTASLHDHNKMLDVRLKSSKGRQLYRLYCQREPFSIAKDTYKPLCLLSKCYILRGAGHIPDPSACGPVGAQTALRLDLQSLGYSLLYGIMHLADSTHKIPYPNPDMGFDRSDPLYFLQFAAPKVVLLEVLSQMWNLNLDMGLTSCGESPCVDVTAEHMSQFLQWCRSLKKRFKESYFFNCRPRFEHPHLPGLVAELLADDFFGPDGRRG